MPALSQALSSKKIRKKLFLEIDKTQYDVLILVFSYYI